MKQPNHRFYLCLYHRQCLRRNTVLKINRENNSGGECNGRTDARHLSLSDRRAQVEGTQRRKGMPIGVYHLQNPSVGCPSSLRIVLTV